MAYDHWAVLVAGSNTYSNYRHQADVHHAYQIMKNNGIPESNIILMSYDDVADSYYNPLPGQLFNKPNGTNVYNQSDISYSGRNVTAEKFLAVLKGDAATAGGPFLQSTENSKVFVYYADHGAPGFVCMPTGGYLYADALQDAVDYMTANKMFNELVFYIEACESGSMFPNLESNTNVYAVTAANASESSWGTYCGSDAVVDGHNMNTCLGDLFSVNWMEDADAADMTTETLEDQFNNVKAETTKSHVMNFGDLDFMDEAIGDFEGSYDAVLEEKVLSSWGDKIVAKIDHYQKKIDKYFDKHHQEKKERSSIDSRDINLHHLFNVYSKTGAEVDRQRLMEEISHRGNVDTHWATIFGGHNTENFTVEKVEDFDCYRFLVNTYEASCGRFSDYSLKYAKNLAYACNKFDEKDLADLVKNIMGACH